MERENRPVWDLYNEYRTARLNKLYFGKQLTELKHWNLVLEIVLAVTASSGIACLWIWRTFAGGIIWQGILAIAALVAVIKPFVNLAGQIQQMSEVLSQWRSYEIDLYVLILRVKQHESYDNEIQNRFISMMEVKKAIIQKEPLEGERIKLKEKCYNQVNEELPSNIFFIPEERKMSDEKEPQKSPPPPPSPSPSPKRDATPKTFTESDKGTRIEPPRPWPRKSED